MKHTFNGLSLTLVTAKEVEFPSKKSGRLNISAPNSAEFIEEMEDIKFMNSGNTRQVFSHGKGRIRQNRQTGEFRMIISIKPEEHGWENDVWEFVDEGITFLSERS